MLDSSGWLEYFDDGSNANEFGAAAEDPTTLVPTIVIYEVFKVAFRLHGEAAAIELAHAMEKCVVVALTPKRTRAAVRLSILHKLAMADSIIYATGRAHDAEPWTQHVNFKGLERVRYFAKEK